MICSTNQIKNFISIDQTKVTARTNWTNLLSLDHHDVEMSVIWLVERSAIKLLILTRY